MISPSPVTEPGASAAAPERSLGLAASIVKARYRVDAIASVSRDVVRYTAEDIRQGRRVLLEVLRGDVAADAEFVAAVRDQAEKLLSAEHVGRAIARVYDCDTTDAGDLLVVVERVEGRTLRELLEARGAFDVPTALRIASQVGEALEALHHNGIVHGELGPDCIVASEEADGIANVKLVGVELTAAHRTSRGLRLRDADDRPELAPEQIDRGETTEASDVHALGRLLRALVVGNAARDTTGPLLGPSPVPLSVQHIITKAAHTRPENRYPDISVMMNDIWAAHAALSEPPAPSRSSRAPRPPARWRLPRPALSLRRAATGAAVAVVTILAWLLVSDQLVSLVRINVPVPSVTALPTAPATTMPAVNPTEPAPSRPRQQARETTASAPSAAPSPAASTASTERAAAPAAPKPSAVESAQPAERPRAVDPPARRRAQRARRNDRVASDERATPAAAPREPQAAPREPQARDAGDGSAIIDWLLKEGR